MVLGRDESKHISCQYKGREADCPKVCEKCAIFLKENGDSALARNDLDLAIKQYRRALFMEPKFADAWVNMGDAYTRKAEYNHALSSFSKAITIDPTYGQALFGKAVVLKAQGRLDEAMCTVNEILAMYKAPDVKKFKAVLRNQGVKELRPNTPCVKAIDLMTDRAYEIAQEHNLLGADGRLCVEEAIYCKNTFAMRICAFCQKRYAALGREKIWGESILAAFYGSLCTTLLFYKDRCGFQDTTPYDYLADHIDLEALERNAERRLGISEDSDEAEKLWNLIYGFVTYCNSVIECVEKDSVEAALIDAAESAYVMGMLFGMRHNEKEKEKRNSLDEALKKLADSTKDYHDTPPRRSAMCYSISVPEKGPVHYLCTCCGKTVTVDVDLREGEEQRAFDEVYRNYQALAEKFTALGYPSAVERLCNDCAEQKYPSGRNARTNNMVFSLIRNDCGKTIHSYPALSWFEETPYRIALAFLNGADTLQKLSEATDTKLRAEIYLKHIHAVLGDISDRIR